MISPKRRAIGLIKILVPILFIIVVTFACHRISWMDAPENNPIMAEHPTDTELIMNFHNNREQFNKLAKLASSETRILVVFPENGECQIENQILISGREDEMCQLYVDLFRELGFMWSYLGNPLYLNVSARAMLPSYYKGYYYSSSDGLPENEKLVFSTDDSLGIRHIEDNWYIIHY